MLINVKKSLKLNFKKINNIYEILYLISNLQQDFYKKGPFSSHE